MKADSHHIETNFNLAIHDWRRYSLADEEVYRRLREVGLSRKSDRRYKQLLGRMYLFFGEYRQAEQYLREAAAMDESVAETWRDLGLARCAVLGEDKDESKWSEVEKCLEKVLSMEYEDPYVITGRAYAMARQGREKEALGFYGKLAAKHRDLPRSLKEAVHRYLPGREVRAAVLVRRAAQVFDLKIDADGKHLRLCTPGKIRVYGISGAGFKPAGDFSYSYDGIKTMRISGLGRTALSGDNDDHMRVWDCASGRLVRKTRQPVTGKIVSVGFNHQGALAAAGGSIGAVFLYDMKSGERLAVYEGHELNVSALAFDPKGRFLVSGSADRTLRVWDLASGRCLHRLEGHEGLISNLGFTQNGNYFLSASDDATLKLWEPKSGRIARTFTSHAGPISAAALIPGGRLMISAGHDNTVRVWDLEAASPLALYRVETRVEAMCLGPDGRRVYLARVDARAKNLKTLVSMELDLDHRYRALYAVSKPISAAVVDALEIEFQEKLAKAEQLLDEARFAETLDLLTEVRGLSGYDRDERALSQWRRLVERFPWKKLRSTWKAAVREEKRGPVLTASLFPDSTKILAGGGDNRLIVWDPLQGEDTKSLAGHTAQVTAVALGLEGRTALSAGCDKTLRLWDLEKGAPIMDMDHNKSRINAAALSPDNRYVLSGADDKTLCLWDLKAGKCVLALKGHEAVVTAAAFGPDGRWAVSGSMDQSLRLWDLTTGKCQQVLLGHTQGVTSLAITPDGKRVYSGSLDQTMREWDLTAAGLVRTYDAHQQAVRTVDISPDGRCALTGGDDMKVCLWDLKAGIRLSVFEGHQDGVTTAVFAPDGQSFVAGSRNGQLTYWRLDWEPEVRRSSNWSEEARPLMEIFLTMKTPYTDSPPERKGRAKWDREDLDRFLAGLGRAGYGWLNSMGVEKELEDATRMWAGPREVAKIFPFKKQPGIFSPDSGLVLSILLFPLKRWKVFALLGLFALVVYGGMQARDYIRQPVVRSIPFGFQDVDFDMKMKDLGPLILLEKKLGRRHLRQEK